MNRNPLGSAGCENSGALYQVVRAHLADFLAEARSRDEHQQGLPDFVEDEFRRFLGCGSLAGGFARLKCEAHLVDAVRSVSSVPCVPCFP